MSALLVLLLAIGCCLGLGAMLLRLFIIDGDLAASQRWAFAFALGFGALGWLMFPLGIAGLLTPLPLMLVLTAGCFGVLLLPRPALSRASDLDATGKVLIAVLCVVMAFNVLEGIAPPADADTLFYHFALPKKYVAAGRIVFFLEPLHGAAAFLIQMTYVPVLALGGELALTFWTMVTGWAAGTVLFVLCRPHLGFNWSLAVVIVFLTTPAVIYGAGSGQVETRLALFVMAAAWATGRAIKTGDAGYAAMAGVAAGFFAGGKYTGLLFAAGVGIVILCQRRWLARGMLFGAALLAAGFQWYAQNWIHTGDPVFPALFQWLGRDDLTRWNKDFDLTFKNTLFFHENPLPRSFALLFTFPFKATLDSRQLLDAGRVGFGPYGLLLAPLAVIGLWRFRGRAVHSPLAVYALLAAFFYVAWFFLGGSQRIRHLLPVLPLFLLAVTVAAARFATTGPGRPPLLAAVAAVILLQLGVHGIFTVNYFRFAAKDAGREAFLDRNINFYPAVRWVNANLGRTDVVYFEHREFRYYLDVPSFFGGLQALVETRPEKTTVRKLHRHLRAAGITHLMLREWNAADDPTNAPLLKVLVDAGCTELLQRFEGRVLQSRSLPTMSAHPGAIVVLKLKDGRCLP